MNTIEAIRTRRSVRSYKSDMPTDAGIKLVMEAGINAPTGRNSQSVIVIAIKDKETRDRYSRANAAVTGDGADRDPFYGAPVVLAVLVRADAPCAAYDGPIALGHMMLAAHEIGLASCWIHRAKEVFETEEWKRWLRDVGVEGEYIGVGNLALGYIEGEYPPAKEKNAGRMFTV